MRTENAAQNGALNLGPGKDIPREELVVRATRASGPGGQHVNTSSTRIELLWNVRHTAVLTAEEIVRAEARLGRRVDSDGWLRIVASESRSQLRNRRLAEERLVRTVRDALRVPRVRRPTRPTEASRQRRLHSKRLHSLRKQERRREGEE
jgi:ribosome-associated protein